ISFSFTVKNVGTLPTPVGNWSDRIVISTDKIYGNADDLPLNPNAYVAHAGVLNPGDSYTVNITSASGLTLPDGISGDFYVMVLTDALNSVNEGPFEGDNATSSNSTFHVNLAPYPDLMVENVAVTHTSYSGNLPVSWTDAYR